MGKVDGITECSNALNKVANKVLEKVPIGVKLTPLGERLVYDMGGTKRVEPLSIKEYPDGPLGIALHDLMATLYTASQYIAKTKREIPITRDELILPKKTGGCTDFGYRKGQLKKLETKDLLTARHTYLTDKRTKNRVGVRTVIMLTPLGRGYVRKHVDKEFMADVQEPDS